MTANAAYMLVLARHTDRARFGRYVSDLSAVYARLGGSYLAVAPAPSVEQFGHAEVPQSVAVSRWPSMARLHAFWESREYRRVARARADAEDFLVVAIDGQPECPLTPPALLLAVILGPGPSPALLEDEGACPLALGRDAEVVRLDGSWAHGDCAIYAFSEAQVARRLLLQYSSGQRGRSLLVPAIAPNAARVALAAAS